MRSGRADYVRISDKRYGREKKHDDQKLSKVQGTDDQEKIL
jgi:hypothetical protein